MTKMKYRSVARNVTNCNRTYTQPIMTEYGLFQRRESCPATLFKKQEASGPNMPSTDSTKGVKEERLASAASAYFLFFSCSAAERTALTERLVYDWASVSTTRTSSNAAVCGCHTPRTLRSATRAGVFVESSASRTIGSLITSLYPIATKSPRASRTSLRRWVTSTPFRQSRAWHSEKERKKL